MTPPEHVRIAVDHGTATIAASLLARVGGAWRLLAVEAAPAAVGQDALIRSLVRAVHAADPSLGRLVGSPANATAIPRLVSRSARPPGVAILAATERRRAALGRVARTAGLDVVGDPDVGGPIAALDAALAAVTIPHAIVEAKLHFLLDVAGEIVGRDPTGVDVEGRFAAVGNFSSYCRCVDSVHTSNNKKKGEGNRKNGNPYLAWAFIEAANFAMRFCPEAKRFYGRKKAKTNRIVALKALAHKLARACYHMLREHKPFDVKRCFA